MALNKLNIISSVNQNEDGNLHPATPMMWDGPLCFDGNTVFTPSVYFDEKTNSSVPATYNCEVITLDAHVKSELDWSGAYQQAEKAIQEGRRIMWFLDLGLFHALPFSLLNNTQYQTLALAVDHFCSETWPRFKEATLGVILYKGSLDDECLTSSNESTLESLHEWIREHNLSLDQHIESVTPEVLKTTPNGHMLLQKFACDVGVDYLDMLAQRFVEEIEVFALVDAGGIKDPVLAAHVFGDGRNSRVRFILKNSVLPPQDIAWESFSPFGVVGESSASVNMKSEKYPLGIAVFEWSLQKETHFEEALLYLLDQNLLFRLIPAELITTQWDGLDELIVSVSAVTPLVLRMLQGFCAAGGTVITAGEQLGLPNEIPFSLRFS